MSTATPAAAPAAGTITGATTTTATVVTAAAAETPPISKQSVQNIIRLAGLIVIIVWVVVLIIRFGVYVKNVASQTVNQYGFTQFSNELLVGGPNLYGSTAYNVPYYTGTTNGLSQKAQGDATGGIAGEECAQACAANNAANMNAAAPGVNAFVCQAYQASKSNAVFANYPAPPVGWNQNSNTETPFSFSAYFVYNNATLTMYVVTPAPLPPCTFTGTIIGTALTVAGATNCALAAGQTISGQGLNAGTTITGGSGTSWTLSAAPTTQSQVITNGSFSVQTNATPFPPGTWLDIGTAQVTIPAPTSATLLVESAGPVPLSYVVGPGSITANIGSAVAPVVVTSQMPAGTPQQQAQWQIQQDAASGGVFQCMLSSLRQYPPATPLVPSNNCVSGYINNATASKTVFLQFIEHFAWLVVFALFAIAYYNYFVEPDFSAFASGVPLVLGVIGAIYLYYVGFVDSSVPLDNGSNCSMISVGGQLVPLPSDVTQTCHSDAVAESPTKGTCYNSCCGRSKTWTLNNGQDFITCTWPNFPCYAANTTQFSQLVPDGTPICAAFADQCQGGNPPVSTYQYSAGGEVNTCTAQDDGATYGIQTSPTPDVNDAIVTYQDYAYIVSLGRANPGSYAGEFDCGDYYNPASQQDNFVVQQYLQPKYLNGGQCAPPGTGQYAPNVSFTMTAQRLNSLQTIGDRGQVYTGNCGLSTYLGRQQLFVTAANGSDQCNANYIEQQPIAPPS